jgi:hypothetical protein
MIFEVIFEKFKKIIFKTKKFKYNHGIRELCYQFCF